MEHFLLPELIVIRHDDAHRIDANRPRDLVLGGVAVQQLAEFEVGERRCLAGVSDSASADAIGPEAGRRIDLRALAPTTVMLDKASFELWELPHWSVGSRTVAHLLLSTHARPLGPAHLARLLLQSLRFESDGVAVTPQSMGTYGSDSVVQCTVEFEEQIARVRVLHD